MQWPSPQDQPYFQIAVATITVVTFFFGLVRLCGGFFRRAYLYWLHQRLLRKFGTSDLSLDGLEEAVKYYVRHHCQDQDPAIADEPRYSISLRKDLFDALHQIITQPSQHRYILLLADSGMGKTTALVNYWHRNNSRSRLPFSVRYVHLGNSDSDQQINNIANKGRAHACLTKAASWIH